MNKFSLASDILYHFTSYFNAYNILQEDQFKLSNDLGTLSDSELRGGGGRFYYLSTTRSLSGGYHRGYSDGVLLKLDGRKLNYNYKAKPVDYWGEAYRDSAWKSGDIEQYQRLNEMEDRVFSYKPIIPHASKYILEIHVLIDTEETQEYKYYYTYKLNEIAGNISIYFYNNKKDFRTLSHGKNYQEMSLEYKEFEPYKSPFRDREFNTFTPYLEIYKAKDYEDLSKETKSKAYYIDLYSDQLSVLMADIHNYKNKDEYRDDIYEIAKIMRREKLTNIKEFFEFTRNKIHELYNARKKVAGWAGEFDPVVMDFNESESQYNLSPNIQPDDYIKRNKQRKRIKNIIKGYILKNE